MERSDTEPKARRAIVCLYRVRCTDRSTLWSRRAVNCRWHGLRATIRAGMPGREYKSKSPGVNPGGFNAARYCWAVVSGGSAGGFLRAGYRVTIQAQTRGAVQANASAKPRASMAAACFSLNISITPGRSCCWCSRWCSRLERWRLPGAYPCRAQ